MRFKPFRVGRHLGWLLHDVCMPGDDRVPSRETLLWTRSSNQWQVMHYWSEGDSAGVAPCVETSLMRIDVTPWFGKPYTLWRTSVAVQVVVQGKPATFERHRSFGLWAIARRDFLMHRDEVRAGLAGSRLFPASLRERDQARG